MDMPAIQHKYKNAINITSFNPSQKSTAYGTSSKLLQNAHIMITADTESNQIHKKYKEKIHEKIRLLIRTRFCPQER